MGSVYNCIIKIQPKKRKNRRHVYIPDFQRTNKFQFWYRYTAQTVDGDFKLRPEDYENCPDYAVLYRMLLRVMDETSDDAALHATQIKKAKHKRRKTDNGPKKKLKMDSDTQPKLSWNNEAERKQLSKMDTHFIGPGSKLLYKVLSQEY